MYFTFEGKNIDLGTEAERYSIIYENGLITFITWIDEESNEYVLSRHASKGTWFRVFIMNDSGRTIRRVECPSA